MIKFAHLRLAKIVEQPSAKNGWTVRTGTDPKGGITIAFDNGKPGDKAIPYAVAYCNPKDDYSKELGREIALGRLNKSALPNVVIVEKGNYSSIVKAIIEDLGRK